MGLICAGVWEWGRGQVLYMHQDALAPTPASKCYSLLPIKSDTVNYNLGETPYPKHYLYATLHGGIEIGAYLEREEPPGKRNKRC